MSQLDHWERRPGHQEEDSMERSGCRWGLAFLIFIVVGTILSFGAYWILAPRPFAGPLNDPNREIPDWRRLQSNKTASEDIADLRQHEGAVLNSAGPSDYHPGAKRIPLDEAMAELARRGLPRHPTKPGTYRLAPSAAEARP